MSAKNNTMQSNLRPIVVMAGGTGGHIFPAMAVAKKLKAAGCPVTWLGTPNSMEARLVPEHGLPIRFINIKALRGKGLSAKLLLPIRLIKAVVQSISILREVKPAAVLGMGGFATGPGGIAAWLLRKPLLVHEQNAVAGMTNRYLAKIAKHVYEAFPKSFGDRKEVIEVGNPIRSEIAALHNVSRQEKQNRPLHVLIVGGSLGAQVLNQTVPAAIVKLFTDHQFTPDDIQIKHQSGERTYADALSSYKDAGVEADLLKFIDDMAAAYQWADIIICRAGALTVSEVSAAGVPAIFVPFPHAVDDHQRKNAEVLSAQGAAIVILQKDLNADSLANAVFKISGSADRLQQMSELAKASAKLEATDVIAAQCLAYANSKSGEAA